MWGGGSIESRIHSARYFPVSGYYKDGRKNTCTGKESIRSFAAHQATMVLFLSTGMLEKLSEELVAGGYQEETPAAIVYKATWPEEKVMHCTVGTLAETAEREKVTKTALIVVGNVLNTEYERSKLYDPAFTTEFRKGKEV